MRFEQARHCYQENVTKKGHCSISSVQSDSFHAILHNHRKKMMTNNVHGTKKNVQISHATIDSVRIQVKYSFSPQRENYINEITKTSAQDVNVSQLILTKLLRNDRADRCGMYILTQLYILNRSSNRFQQDGHQGNRSIYSDSEQIYSIGACRFIPHFVTWCGHFMTLSWSAMGTQQPSSS